VSAGPLAGWPHHAELRVRYHECDMQKVVFNAHYLTWCDEAMSSWLGATFGWTGADDGFDWMLVRVELDWRGSATFGDVVGIGVGISRWGTTSFATRFHGVVGERTVFEATVTYVCVAPGTTEKVVVPAEVRERLALAPT